MKKTISAIILICTIAASGCVSLKSQAFSSEVIQGFLSTLPHSFTGSKHVEENTGFNVGFSIDFKGLKYDETAKQWTWTAASYSGHSPWTSTNISDSPEGK